MKRIVIRAAAVLLVCGGIAVLLACRFGREPSYQGRPVSAWVADVQSGKPGVRAHALEALQALGPDAIDYLEAQTGTGNGAIRRFASALSRHMPQRVKNLARNIYDPRKETMRRYEAAQALAALGTNAESALEPLGRMLHDPNVLLSSGAAAALGGLGSAAVPVLVQGLDEADYNVRASACGALGRIGTNAAAAVPRLCAIIEHETGPIVTTAAYALLRIGPPAAPALTPLLSSTNANIRLWAAYALSGAGGSSPEATAALLRAKNDENADVRWKVVQALSQDRIASPEVSRALLSATRDPDRNVRSTAVGVLATQPRIVRAHFKEFEGFLSDGSPEVRGYAAMGIGLTGSFGTNGLAGLRGLLNDPNGNVQMKAREAISRIEESADRSK